MRVVETLNVLTNAELVIHACLARKASSKQLNFTRTDYPTMDPYDWHKFVTVKKRNGGIEVGEIPIDYYGPLAKSYEANNQDYIEGTWKKT
jgi:succinate dehydrogenase/fumarate reductase flavoprotein subunit